MSRKQSVLFVALTVIALTIFSLIPVYAITFDESFASKTELQGNWGTYEGSWDNLSVPTGGGEAIISTSIQNTSLRLQHGSYRFGEVTVSFKTNNMNDNYINFGWFSRSPWANPACVVTGSRNRLSVSCGNGSNSASECIVSQVLANDTWHTATLKWRSTKVELIVDNIYCGSFADKACIPQSSLPLVWDYYNSTANTFTAEFSKYTYVNNDFYQTFGSVNDITANWSGLPSWASVSNGSAILSPPNQSDEARLTSYGTYKYGMCTVTFQSDLSAAGNNMYFGWFDRATWGDPGVCVMSSNGKLYLMVRDGANTSYYAAESPSVTPDDLHTVSLIWRPGSVEMFYDGVSCGICRDADAIPDTELPLILDVVRSSSQPLPFVFSDYMMENLSFYQEFTDANDLAANWDGVPSWATVSDGVATFTPPNQGDQCRMTSKNRYSYSTCTVKFKGDITTNNIYFGWFNRSPIWGDPSIHLMNDGGRLILNVGNGTGTHLATYALQSPVVTTDDWHTVSLIWKPDSVEMIYDGQSCGLVRDAACIPNSTLPLILDVVRSTATSQTLQVGTYMDEVPTPIEPVLKYDQAFTAISDFTSNWSCVPAWMTLTNGVAVFAPPNQGDECRMTSKQAYKYGKCTVTFRSDLTYNNVYWGWFSRTPVWGDPSIHIMSSNGRLYLNVCNGSNSATYALQSPVVTPTEWHTVSLIWKPTSVEMIYDGKSCGVFYGTQCIPNSPLPLILDVVRGTSYPQVFELSQYKMEPNYVASTTMDFPLGSIDVKTAPALASELALSSVAPSSYTDSGSLGIANGNFDLLFDAVVGQPFRLSRIYNHATGVDSLISSRRSKLFHVWVDGTRYDSDSFVYSSATHQTLPDGSRRATVTLTNSALRMNAVVTITLDTGREATMGLSFTNNRTSSRSVRVNWPYLENISVGSDLTQNYFLFPYRSGWTGNDQCQLVSAYGCVEGGTQLLSLYNPSVSSGLYTYLKDNSGRPKAIYLRKVNTANTNVPVYTWTGPPYGFTDNIWSNNTGMSLAYYSWSYSIAGSGSTLNLPDTALGVHTGDLRVATKAYSTWAHTWFDPLDTPQWRKDIFSTTWTHDTLGGNGYANGAVQNYSTIQMGALAKPYYNLVQWSAWSNHTTTDYENELGYPEDARAYSWYKQTIGDFSYESDWGGLPALHDAIDQSRVNGTNVVLYGSTPYFSWRKSAACVNHPEWRLVNSSGSPATEADYWHPANTSANPPIDAYRNYDMCPWVSAWQDYVADQNQQIIADTGADGVYLDTMNYIFPSCYGPQFGIHTHGSYDYPQQVAKSVLQKVGSHVRAANPQAVVDVETVNSDYLMQYIDESWDKTFEPTMYTTNDPDHFDYYGVNFLRFIFPEAKLTEFGQWFKYGGRRAFFSGVASNITPAGGAVLDPQTGLPIFTESQEYEYYIATTQTLKEVADAISSTNPECLINTLQSSVWANKFPAAGKTVYTLYNKSDNHIYGDVLSTPVEAGYHCVELLYDNEVPYDTATGKIAASINPWEVVCVAKFQNLLSLSKSGSYLTITVPGSVTSPTVRILATEDNGKELGDELQLVSGSVTINLDQFNGEKIVIKLFDGSYLADERTVCTTTVAYNSGNNGLPINYSIAGNIMLPNYIGDITKVPITLELRKHGGSIATRTVNLDANGKFELTGIGAGTYDIAIKASHWLQKILYGVAVGNI